MNQLLLPLLLLHLLSLTSPVFTSDTTTLLSFKSSLPFPQTLSNWLPHSPICSFTGVACNNDSKVSSLDLSFTPLSLNFSSLLPLFTIPQLTSLTLKSTNISGSLSPINACSSYLSHLDLSLNSISSPFLDLAHFTSCSSLKSLNLSSNSLGSSNYVDGVGFELKIESLDLSFNHLLVGDQKILPWVLSNACSSLTYLSFKGNKLMGSFSLVGCSNLEFLDLSLNNFSIHLSSFSIDCPKLNHLDLSSNKFGGQVGDSFTDLNNLVFLNVSKNELLGGFPSISSSSLEYLYLSDNHFHGVIPTNFPNEACSTLVEFDLSGNNFTGTIPTGFGFCSLMETFDISYNHFHGSLPFDMFLRMDSLKNLLVASNSFVSTLPYSISGFASLETLDLSSNNISGKIPSGICENPLGVTLKELYLQDNELTGPIPTDLGNCSHLVSLDLSFNFLNGRIPASLGSLSKLKDLIIWMNHLEGEIPSELGYTRALENLILDYNQLTGTIPSGLRNCTNLNWISLSSNKLSGEIPSWIGSLANLAILKLSNNSFYGHVPAELGDCRSLLWLDLNSNLLNGSIPPNLAKQSGNMAVGLVVGKKFVYLRNDGNKECHGTGNLLEFAGIRQESLERIPSNSSCNFTRIYMGNTQPTFNHNGSMIFLDLSYNKLEGGIPKELGSMYYLNILNLGNNNLSGPIPLELGGLKNVGVLDLSHNQLSGQIPNSLSGLTLLTEIDLSNNQLSGAIPETAQFETFPGYRFANNSGLCGYPLESCDHNSASNASHKKSGKKASLVGRVAMVLLFSLFCIFGLIIVGIEVKRRRTKKDSTLDIYNDNNSHSGTINSAWKFTSKNEAMSISLATFAKPLRKLTFADLLEATNGFHDDSLIGRGGFGDVYKAQLKDGSVVAIKKLIHVSGQGDKEFTAEMETIGKIQYHNLVPLLGYCKVGDERLLVYEYMKYGSLEDVLHDRKKVGIKLDWVARRKIAFGAARGLAFLHHSCNPHIIHRDMKSSNVLLDEELEARVSDFGMARYMSAMDTHLSVSTLAGTPGYVPPEYYQSFKCSTKGDVYSYGVVLLELLTGKPPTDSADFGDTNLVGWVKQHAKLRISDVFDGELMKEDPNLEIELLQHLKVACACLDDRPWKRPTMIQVLAMFKEIQAGLGLDSRSTTITEDDDGSLGTMGGSFCTVDVLDLSLKEIPENNPRE